MEVEQFGEMMKRFNSELEKLTGKREKESETTSQKELQIRCGPYLDTTGAYRALLLIARHEFFYDIRFII